jgi:predicted RecA/RadA family phage recombinase
MCEICKGINPHLCPVCGESMDKISCPSCRGLGYKKCWAISVNTGKELEVTAETFLSLPRSENEAISLGKKYYQLDADDCALCGGTGDVWQDARGNYHRVE